MITKPTIYTEEYVLKEVRLLLDTLLKDKTIFFKGQLFEYKPYSRFRFSEWVKKYGSVKEIMHTVKRIDEILETRAIVGTAKGELRDAPMIFHLKHNYKWKDTQTIEQDMSGGLKIVYHKEGQDTVSDSK